MRNIFKIPDHWHSTEWHTNRYLQEAEQARMSDEQFVADRKQKREEAKDLFDNLLPHEEIENVERAERRSSLKKKMGAAILLAVSTVVAPNGQYANGLNSRPATQENVVTSVSEECHDAVQYIPAKDEIKTFTITGAYNDALSEEGRHITEAEFDSSTALRGAKNYIEQFSGDTHITQVNIHGSASDESRANINAGIGERDDVNQNTARSYVSIASNSIKKLFVGKTSPRFIESAEERILTPTEQGQLDLLQEKAGFATKHDLLSAYNDVQSALSTSDRSGIDELIGQHRGVEITIHTTTPGRTITQEQCTPVTPETPETTSTPTDAKRPFAPLFYGDPQATLPEWSRVTVDITRRSDKRDDLYGFPPFRKRIMGRMAALGSALKHDGVTFKEDMQFIGRGFAGIGATVKSDTVQYATDQYKTWILNEPAKKASQYDLENYGGYVRPVPKTRRERALRPISDAASEMQEYIGDAREAIPKKTRRFVRRSNARVRNIIPSIRETAEGIKNRQAEINKMASIPVSDLHDLSRDNFYDTHGVFPEDHHEARHTLKTLPLRRFIQKQIKHAK